ncbi:MAG: hypothetical protein ACT4PW_03390 [Acidimicrobiia bacterium]
MLAVMAGCSRGGSGVVVDYSHVNFRSVGQLADSSEYVVFATSVDPPIAYEHSGDDLMALVIGDVELTGIVAIRPDASLRPSEGERVTVGIALLETEETLRERGDESTGTIMNYEQLAREFPTVDQAFARGDSLLLFMVDSRDSRADFELAGYALVDEAAHAATFKAMPGELAGRTEPSNRILETVTEKLREPAPWRTSKASDMPEVSVPPADGRPPLAPPR